MKTLTEGKSKGNRNDPPKVPRPNIPPKGQGMKSIEINIHFKKK